MQKVHVYVKGSNFYADRVLKYKEVPRLGEELYFCMKGVPQGDMQKLVVQKVCQEVFIWKLFWFIPIQRHRTWLDVNVASGGVRFSESDWNNHTPWGPLGVWLINNKWKVQRRSNISDRKTA